MAKPQDLRNVLDALLDSSPPTSSSPARPARPSGPPTRLPLSPPREEASGLRERITVSLDAELLAKARNAAFYTPGTSLTDLVASGLSRELNRLEKLRGGAFPTRTAELKPGRKIRQQ